ncbi:MAG: NUDIX hydrolase [Burkholderiales bacterium]
MTWKPNVTVAAVVEKDGKFLLVEEEAESGVCLNQPAGHLEANETIIQGVIRETLEETGYQIAPQSLIGIYRWQHLQKDIIYLRFTFAAVALAHDGARRLDHGIIATHWLTYDEIAQKRARHRTPMVLRSIDDYLAGRRYPLDVLTHL